MNDGKESASDSVLKKLLTPKARVSKSQLRGLTADLDMQMLDVRSSYAKVSTHDPLYSHISKHQLIAASASPSHTPEPDGGRRTVCARSDRGFVQNIIHHTPARLYFAQSKSESL